MCARKKWKRSSLVFTVCSLATNFCQAQEVAAKPAAASSGNQFVILLGAVALILAFVIYGMGQVLLAMGRQVLDKNKQAGKVLTACILMGCTLLSLPAHTQELSAAPVVAAPNYGGFNSTGFWTLVSVLTLEVLVIAYLMYSIQRLQAELLPPRQQKKWLALKALWRGLDRKLFTKAVAVEKEQDVLLDHDYDGIRELDNALPPWWKYGFLVTIFIAVIYMLNFHVFGYGKNPVQEYEAELVKAQEDKEAYDAKNKDKVDETNIQMPGADGISEGKEIFTTACWACHGKLGEGGAGPNLTDDYWIHKGSISDVYQSIKHGYPDKGMQAWGKNYSPKQINNLAGFIKTLHGSNPPNAKAPQGDLFTEDAPAAPAADSSKATK